ncbi:MAG: hypothetical protein JRM80_13800, partial [Nitrososphaerota archaeon]|nr:hypothetical protein [Nitrososphaerota archaeon]
RKVRAGISFDAPIVAALDENVKLMGEEKVTRSEEVNAIIREYLERCGTAKGIRQLVMKWRGHDLR